MEDIVQVSKPGIALASTTAGPSGVIAMSHPIYALVPTVR